MKRKFVIGLLMICLAALLSGIVQMTFASEESGGGNVLKCTFRMPENVADGEYVMGWVSPYQTAPADARAVLKKGAVLCYDVYSPTPVAGIGGIDAIYNVTWEYMSDVLDRDRSITDQNGAWASQLSDLSDFISNGWYSRRIELPETVTGDGVAVSRAPYHWAFGIVVKTPVDYNELVVYYKNVRLENPDGSIAYIFRGDEQVSQYNFYRTYEHPTDLTSAKNYLADPTRPGSEAAFSVQSVADPAPIKIDRSQTDAVALVNDPRFNFMNLVGSEVADRTLHITLTDKDGTWLAETGNGISGTRYLFEQTGAYKVKYDLIDGTNLSRLVVDLDVIGETEHYIYYGDVPQSTQTAVAGEKVVYPVVQAYFGKSKTVATTLSAVYAETGESLQANRTEQGWEIAYPEKRGGIYELTYSVEGDDTVARSFFVAVQDLDVPVINLELLPSVIPCGVDFIIPPVEVTDLSDGIISEYTVLVTDPDGKEVVPENGTLYPQVSGMYHFSVSAEDRDGNVTVAEKYVKVDIQKDQLLRVHIDVDPAQNTAGKRKYMVVSLYDIIPNGYSFKSGDVLYYDIYSPTPVQGIGGFSGSFGETVNWKRFEDTKFFEEGTDSMGLSVAPTSDLSSQMIENGQPVWYNRAIELKSDFLTSTEMVHFSLIIDTTAVIPENGLDVYYRNIYIRSENGSTYTLYDGTQTLNLTPWEFENVDNQTGWSIRPVLDWCPVLREEFLPARAEIGTKITLNRYVMYDYTDKEILAAEISVFDPKDNPVELDESNAFMADIPGVYRLVYYAENSAGEFTRKTIELRVADTQVPTILVDGVLFSSESVYQELRVGETAELPAIAISDNYTKESDLDIQRAFFDPNGSAVVVNGNEFTAEMVGDYMYIVSATDAAGNRNLIRIFYSVTEDGGQEGCGGNIADPCFWAGVAMIGLTVLALVIRRKEKNAACKR